MAYIVMAYIVMAIESGKETSSQPTSTNGGVHHRGPMRNTLPIDRSSMDRAIAFSPTRTRPIVIEGHRDGKGINVWCRSIDVSAGE